MRKVLILFIKFMPIIQMVGMLFNNSLYCFDVCSELSYTLDFVIGNSLVTTLLLFVCSYVFDFCIWHRLIITANLINITIASIDSIVRLNITDIQLLILYHIIAAIFIIISTIVHIREKT